MNIQTLPLLKFRRNSSKNVEDIIEIFYQFKWRKILLDRTRNNWQYFNCQYKKIGLRNLLSQLNQDAIGDKGSLINLPFNSVDFITIWKNYLQHRRELNAKQLTSISTQLIFSKLAIESKNNEKIAIYMINNTIVNNWVNIVFIQPPSYLLNETRQNGSITPFAKEDKNNASINYQDGIDLKQWIQCDYNDYLIKGNSISINSFYNRGVEILISENKWDFIDEDLVEKYLPDAIAQITALNSNNNSYKSKNDINVNNGAVTSRANRLALKFCFQKFKELEIVNIFS